MNLSLKISSEPRGLIYGGTDTTNIAGFRLSMPRDYAFDEFWGPMNDDFSDVTTVTRDDPEIFDAALLKMFGKVFDSAGRQRPR